MKPLTLLFVLAGLPPTMQATAQDCSSCPHALSPVIYQGPCEWELHWRTECRASLASMTATVGAPGAPMVLRSGTCNACDCSQDQSTTLPWTKTTGWQFCLTVGGGVKWVVPIGPEWHIQGEFQVCYDTETTEGVVTMISCAAGTIVDAVVVKSDSPVTLTMHVLLDKIGTYNLTAGGGGCAQTRTLTVPCDEYIQTHNETQSHYDVIFTTLTCPIPVGGGAT